MKRSVAQILAGSRCLLRAWLPSDVDSLIPIANDPYVGRYLSQYFPLPYTHTNADEWVRSNAEAEAAGMFAVEHDGKLVGGIGCAAGTGDRAGTAVLGYWLGRLYWGHGIATDAVGLISEWSFRVQRVRRICATVMSPNLASARVLEKNGYGLEGRLHGAIIDRTGAVHDELIYARFR